MPSGRELLLVRTLASELHATETRLLAQVAARDATIEALRGRLEALEARGLIHGRDGRDGAPGPMGERGMPGDRGEPGRDGTPGRDGSSVTLADLTPIVEAEVRKAVAAIPPPRDGQEGPPGPRGERGIDGAPGRDGRDGLPGTTGLPGEKGLDGRPGADGVDGRDGKDGVDGLGFEDLDVVFDEDQGVRLRWARADVVKERPLPTIWDAGVWKAGRTYPRGAGVTWQGAFWFAQRETNAKPGEPTPESRAWRLAVKAGRDAKPRT